MAVMRDHLEGPEKDAKPVPEPNWLGCATAVESTEAAVVVGVNDLVVGVRTAAVSVLEHNNISKVFAVHEDVDERTHWQWTWQWKWQWSSLRYDFGWRQPWSRAIGTSHLVHHSGEWGRIRTWRRLG